MDNYILGIDIGTTSVKVCVLNTKNNSVVAEQSKDTQSDVPSDQGIDGNKQDVPKIISAINTCVAKFSKDLLQQVTRIGVCGQMHGVMFWHHRNEAKAWERIEKDGVLVRYDVKQEHVSNAYTWQDSRCSKEFLGTLPVPNSHLEIASGYGTATIFWMIQNRPEEMKKYDYAGTIQDFAVAMLTDSQECYISDQNAASWGYFDCRKFEWNKDILAKGGFPTELLPVVKISGTIVGNLADTWHCIPKGTQIGVAMGDLQCSVLSTIEESADAVLNISTSAQLAYVVTKNLDEELSAPPKSNPTILVPYFNSTFLAVAASLNGGNTLATFVKALQQWFLEFGFSVPQGKMWTKLIELTNDEKSVSNLVIKPTCFGERHDPDAAASVSNINTGNLGLGQVFRALCEGMIRNLHSMMTKEVLKKAQISRIICSGAAITRNETLQNSVKEIYDLPLKLASGSDAAKGAAMAMKST